VQDFGSIELSVDQAQLRRKTHQTLRRLAMTMAGDTLLIQQ